MLKNILVSFLLLSGTNIVLAQISLPSNQLQFGVFPGCSVKWNNEQGILYKQVPGANLGAISFTCIDTSHVAFLFSSSDEIIITEGKYGNMVKKFTVKGSPRDFVFSNGYFFVLTENSIVQYDTSGKKINSFAMDDKYRDVERIARYNESTYLLLPSGSSVMIEMKGYPITPQEQEGWITGAGYYVSTSFNYNSFSIKLRTRDIANEASYNFEGTIAGVYPIGIEDNSLYLDVQTFISENPVKTERYIIVLQINSGYLGPLISSMKVPEFYYVLTNKDFVLTEDGRLLNMMTEQDGIFIWSLSENIEKNKEVYNYQSKNTGYHYNDHLLKLDGDEESTPAPSLLQITRAQIINNATPYTNYTWTANSCNLWNNMSCGSKNVLSASWVAVGTNKTMPYCWGGWSTMQEHDNAMINCKSAGDINTAYSFGAGLNCASGHDCSGFVTRAWGLNRKYSTSTLPEISTPINLTQTRPGDILNVAGSHVRLITTNYGNGNYQVIEASGIDWKTTYHSYTTAQLTSYIPGKFNYVIEEASGLSQDLVDNSLNLSLQQNYPNPFNPQTTIRFRNPAHGYVQLKIYNILGKEVAAPINEIKPAGSYEINFDGSKLPGGIYLYILYSQGKSVAKKMCLLK